MQRNLWIVLLISLLSFFSLSAVAKTVDGVVAFGDSLTDNGNLYAMDRGYEPIYPYFHGRFTNSFMWVERLTDKLGLPPSMLQDYAFAGAQTSGLFPPSLRMQVDHYVKTQSVDPNTLYLIWSGGDNYLDDPNGTKALVEGTVDDIKYTINELVSLGAQNILVLNLPDIGKTPLAQQHAKNPHGVNQYARHLSHLSRLNNRMLRQTLRGLRKQYKSQGVTLMEVDVFNIFEQIVKHPNKFGILNATDSCYTGPMHKTKNPTPVAPCKLPGTYLFWDKVHPTQAGHQLIADRAIAVLSQHGITRGNPLADTFGAPSQEILDNYARRMGS